MLSSMMRNMGKNLSRMNKSEEMLATGKRFLAPSDDPIGVSRSLRFNTEVANMEQFKRNAEDALSWMGTTEMALENLGDILHRAKELTIQASNDTNTVDERKAIAAEIDQLKHQIINIANTTYAGSHIFSGFKTDKPLLKSNGDYNVTSLSASENIEFNLGVSDKLSVNIVGQRIFGTIDHGKGINDTVDGASTVVADDTPQLIAVFSQLVSDLSANPAGDIQASISRLDIHFNNINAVRAEIGVKTNRVELTLNRIADDTLNLKDLLSKNEDADMAEVIMNLKMQENVYKASLSGGARIIQPTLIDFLR